jgi:hypothetical protein
MSRFGLKDLFLCVSFIAVGASLIRSGFILGTIHESPWITIGVLLLLLWVPVAFGMRAIYGLGTAVFKLFGIKYRKPDNQTHGE